MFCFQRQITNRCKLKKGKHQLWFYWPLKHGLGFVEVEIIKLNKSLECTFMSEFERLKAWGPIESMTRQDMATIISETALDALKPDEADTNL